MGLAGPRRHAVLVVGFVLLHFVLRPLLVRWPGTPDLLTGALLLAALRLRAGHAASLGFLLALLEGAMALSGMGPLMIVYTLVGYLAARSRDLIFTDARVFVPLYLFVGVWLSQVALAGLSGSVPSLGFGLLAAPATALSTSLTCWLGVRLLAPAAG